MVAKAFLLLYFLLDLRPDESDPRVMDELTAMEAAADETVDDLFEGIVPLNSFALHDHNQRTAFLCEFCKVGEPALFEAVGHIWSSLEEPREARCIAMGMAAGTGGKGKIALVRLLRACLKDVVTWGGTLPRHQDHSSLGDWHEATMDAFEAERMREDRVFARYSAFLGGSSD